MEPQAGGSANGAELDFAPGVRLLVLSLPEDEGEGLGLRLTRTLWDPYPWVREVSRGGVAAAAGLRPGDCLLQADGKDLLGLPVGAVASLIRGDGAGRDVTLLAWHCGRDPTTDPELLWSCGGGLAGERSRRALEGVLRALACCVCAATATAPRHCRRDHLYCAGCWSRLERCALCRETLPGKDSPYARNLVAEQVFEAIATEYEIKNVQKSASAYTSPQRSPNMSPNMSPSAQRRGQYQLSLMRKKHVQFSERNRNYASDPNLHRTSEKGPTFTLKVPDSEKIASSEDIADSTDKNTNSEIADSAEKTNRGNSKCSCQRVLEQVTWKCNSFDAVNSDVCCHCQKEDPNIHAKVPRNEEDTGTRIPHRLVAQLRSACSLRELPAAPACLSSSLDDLHRHCNAHGSLNNIRNATCEPPVVLVSPPVYVVTCRHAAPE